jgi:hypothetical protein
MFRIPSFYKVEMTFEEASKTITSFGRGDMLEGMEAMNRVWDEYLASQNAFYKGETDEMVFGDDDDFFDHYGYECSAYNVVFEGMSKLFEEAA